MDADSQSPAASPVTSEPLSVGEVVLPELRRQLAAWREHEPGARLGRDPEALHQLRVAARRIEAVLGVFRRQLTPALLRARAATKGVLRTLGTARDFDVQLEQLAERCADLSGEERAAAEPLRQRLEQERARARSQLLRAFDAEPTRHWLQTLEQAANEGLTGPPAAALAVLPRRVRRRFRKLKRAVRAINGRSEMEDLHTVRRRAKQFRYALECAAPLSGKQAETMLKALRTLQDELGAHQDAEMMARRLTRLAADSEALPPRTLFLMGRLAEHKLGSTQAARKTLARTWRKVGKRWRPLRTRLQALGTPEVTKGPAATEGPSESARSAEPSAPELPLSQALRH